MLLLNKEDIRKVYGMSDAIGSVKKAFRLSFEEKCQVPQRTIIPTNDGSDSLLFMPAYCGEAGTAAMKIIGVYGDNPKKGLPTCPASVLLFDGTTGMVRAMMDGTFVTQLRTGAASGAAFDLLAKEDCRTGALIGNGGQAETQLEAMLCARKLQRVYVYSRNEEKCRDFARKMQEKLASYGAEIVPALSSREAVKDADLIIAATPSHTPVFDAGDVKPGCTVSAIGSYLYDMQELDPALLAKAGGIYFDSKEAVLAESGDIIRPLEDGTISTEDLTGDLGGVICGAVPGRKNDSDIIVFKTVGIAIQDLVTAGDIYAKASSAGIGTDWSI